MKKKSKTKKIKFIILFLITLIIFITIFIKNHYKFSENGNNINSKQSEEIVNDILNISSYKAEIEMTVTNIYSNDNNKEIVEEKEEIVLKCKKEGNKYNVYYELNIDKKTGKPTKLLIRDVNKKEVVYIVYTKVEMSS